jgi:hypothetical protein
MLSFSTFSTGVTRLNSGSDPPIDPELSIATEDGNLSPSGHHVEMDGKARILIYTVIIIFTMITISRDEC